MVLGPVHFLILDGFAHYDPVKYHMIDKSLTEDQLAWLEDSIAKTSAPRRVLAIHYDYTDQLMSRLQELSIDAVFYGHGGSKDQAFFDSVGALNGHLPGGMAYRQAEISEHHLDLGQPVGFDVLGIPT